MASTFIGLENIPVYIALSTDISSNAIAGCSIIGATVFLTDTEAWKIVTQNLTLADFVFP